MTAQRIYGAPTTLNIELTERCNAACPHCYNTWRGRAAARRTMEPGRLENLLREAAERGVFHVIFSGGEPLLALDLLERGCRLAGRLGLSFGVNSNLLAATPELLGRLRAAGVEHILTSLAGPEPAAHDRAAGRPGAFALATRAIRAARSADIRISVNMVLGPANASQAYRTALLAAELGAQRIFGTRMVPQAWAAGAGRAAEAPPAPEALLEALEGLLRARDETGIGIGALVGYPLCFLGDLERFRPFVGRGCPAQRGVRMSVGAGGEAHCCVHEERGYGNVFEEGIVPPFQAMSAWRRRDYRHPGCAGCSWLEVCESGCRMCAAAGGSLSGPDPLMRDPGSITRPLRAPQRLLAPEAPLEVASSVRFRREDGFYLANLRLADTIELDDGEGRLLESCGRTGASFPASALEPGGGVRRAGALLARGLLRRAGEVLPASAPCGLGLDPAALPEEAWNA